MPIEGAVLFELLTEMLCSIARTFVRRDLLPVIINFSRKASSRAGNFTVQVDEGNSLSSNMEGVEVKLITQVLKLILIIHGILKYC